jgi:hypothetical protein
MLVNSLPPEVIGTIKLRPGEFCYSVYMPVKVDNVISIPESLRWTTPLLLEVTQMDYKYYRYWYLTVKHMWVDGYGNRPGWHCDGFLSDDVNYIWSDCNPTQFCVQRFYLEEDHERSLIGMEEQADPKNIVTVGENQLLRLTSDMVHRTVPTGLPTLRTFVKISCSNSKYNLKGNATNPSMYADMGQSVARSASRNHPFK